jgi:hypothetical protein
LLRSKSPANCTSSSFVTAMSFTPQRCCPAMLPSALTVSPAQQFSKAMPLNKLREMRLAEGSAKC